MSKLIAVGVLLLMASSSDSKPCEHTKRSQINMCVYDSTWEATESR